MSRSRWKRCNWCGKPKTGIGFICAPCLRAYFDKLGGPEKYLLGIMRVAKNK